MDPTPSNNDFKILAVVQLTSCYSPILRLLQGGGSILVQVSSSNPQ